MSVLRPYGVWAVISPFNFPLALAAGPSGGALVAGNTVVFKPASATPLLGYKLYEVMADAGLPPGVFNFVTGGGSTAGQELIDNTDVDGIVFTGSKDVGMHLIRDNAARPVPRPLIIEMGGKNPALVMKIRQSRQGERRRHAIGVRRSGSEVLGLLARLREQGGSRRSSCVCSLKRPGRSRSATRSTATSIWVR